LPAASRQAFRDAVSHGLHGVVIGAAIISVVVLATSWLIHGRLPSTPSAATGDQ
jgi:hypothetical protein